MNQRTIPEIIDSDLRVYSMYTIENRAIPSIIDGFKPTQRKIVYAMINEHNGKRTKVSDLGAISKYNYHHGETSAIEAAVKLTADWSNILPVFTGDGTFGSRLVQTAAAARYIFAELSPYFYNIFDDFEVCPVNIDHDNPEPQVYLPVIPWVLVNGISGVATGYACNYLPHDPISIIDCIISKILGKGYLDIKVKFPYFKGSINCIANKKYKVTGIVQQDVRKGHYIISELPIGYDREAYITLLNKMVDNGQINNYTDMCDATGFNFKVKVNPAYYQRAEKDLIKFFSLEKIYTENYTSLDENGKLKIFDSISDIVDYFVDYRLKKIDERIKYDIDVLNSKINELTNRYAFIDAIISEEIVIHNLTKKQLEEEIKKYFCDNISDHEIGLLVNIPVYKISKDHVEDLQTNIANLKTDLNKLMQSNPNAVYIAKLKSLREILIKGEYCDKNLA